MNKLQIGDIGFSFKKRNLFSLLVYMISRWKTKSTSLKKISHAFIYMGDGLIAEASFHGVVIVSIEKYNNVKYDLYFKRTTIIMTPQEQQTLWMHAAKQAGLTKYSYGQLIIMLFGKIFNIKMKDYSKADKVCSEFVSEAYRLIDINLTGKQDASEDTPLDLFDSEKLVDV